MVEYRRAFGPGWNLAAYRFEVFVAFGWELFATFQASVTSWRRTPAHNAGLEGAVPDSEHQTGTALDIVFDPGSEPAAGYFVAWCRERGVKAIKEADHWHLELLTTLP